MRMDKGKTFTHIEADDGSAPTFSESFLYEKVGKGDARFILGVADEYEHVIEALGTPAVRAILDVKPKLVRRLKVGDEVRESLADARDERAIARDEQFPAEITIDSECAHAIWTRLHGEYRRLFEPEKSMDADALRLYNLLTDKLGEWEKEQRQAERDRADEKLERKARQREVTRARTAAWVKVEEAQRDGEGLSQELLTELIDAENARFTVPTKEKV